MLKTVTLILSVFIMFAVPGNSEIYRDQNIQRSPRIVIVENPSSPKYKEDIFKMDLETEIKVEEEGKYILNKPNQIILDDHHNIYILDIKELNIKKFDQHGRYLLTIGKAGLGPGELSGLSSIFIANNELVAWCGQNNHFNYFDLNGKFRKSQLLSMRIDQVKCDSKGNIFGVRSAGEGEQTLVQLNENLLIKMEIDKRAWEPPKYYGVGLLYSLTKDNTIVVGNSKGYEDYEIKEFNSSGELIRLIRKEHRPMRVPREDIESLRKNNPLNWQIPDYLMPFSRIYTNEAGMIITAPYARRGEKKEMGFDIFDKMGKYLSHMLMDSYFYHCLWGNGRLYAIQENDDGYLVVRVYKLNWKI